MNDTLLADVTPLAEIISGISDGSVVPYLGPGVLRGVSSNDSDEQIPADSDSLILAMNGGRPMAAKLMYEFPRAAMNLELKRGRKFVERFLTGLYGEQQWRRSLLHDWLSKLSPRYIIDINRDTQLQECFTDLPHTLIVGAARISASDYRFQIYRYDGSAYSRADDLLEIEASLDGEPASATWPVLFKPMGTPLPEPSYVASDADYVDYITELMGGFAIPSFIKKYRRDKKYLFLGLRLTRDTERMVLSDMIYGSGKPAGWALIPEPNAKERRFCAKQNIEIIEADWDALMTE